MALLFERLESMKTVEFYYDFASPTAFLGYHRIRKLTERYDFNLIYKPILLGALHKAAGNTPPGLVPAKGVYMLADMERFSKLYDIPLEFNPHFPVNCIKSLRGAIVMEGNEQEEQYREAIYNAVWQDQKNIAEEEVFTEVLDAAGIDSAPILLGVVEESVKQKLKDNTEEAVNRGAFGAPTFFIDEQMFFGQDRLDFVEKLLS